MKKTLSLLYITFSFLFITAQNSSSLEQDKKYKITAGNEIADDFFISSFERADWDKYRYEDTRRTLMFKNGVVIELLSAKELTMKNIPFNNAKVIPKGIQSKSEATFTINENGHVIELHTYNMKK